MNSSAPGHPALLAPGEAPAARVVCERGRSTFLLCCDHAGSLIPRALGSLGLDAVDLQRHIAWDIGAAGLAVNLALRLDAFLILQNYSRLVIDCNRPPGSAESIIGSSDGTRIPGNESISMQDEEIRRREIFLPYHDRLGAELELRRSQRRPTVLICLHSFTPRLRGQQRPWHAGVLYNRDARFAAALLQTLRELPDLVIGDNEPYSVDDQTDYTIPVHGEQRGVLHAAIEVRQDLLADEAGQLQWADCLHHALERALSRCQERTPETPRC